MQSHTVTCGERRSSILELPIISARAFPGWAAARSCRSRAAGRRRSGWSHCGSPAAISISPSRTSWAHWVLKGAAYLVDSRDKDRHLRDAAVLAATITDHRTELRRLKGSDRKRIRQLQQALADPRHIAWLSLPAELRVPGRDTLRILGSDPPNHAVRSDA